MFGKNMRYTISPRIFLRGVSLLAIDKINAAGLFSVHCIRNILMTGKNALYCLRPLFYTLRNRNTFRLFPKQAFLPAVFGVLPCPLKYIHKG